MEIDASLVTAVTLPAGYVGPLSAGSRMVVTGTDTILAGTTWTASQQAAARRSSRSRHWGARPG